MGTNKYDDGPWRVVRSPGEAGALGAFEIVPPSGLSVATVLDEGNARLVAAAPDLVEALRGLIRFPLGTFQVKAALDAIQKATGHEA